MAQSVSPTQIQSAAAMSAKLASSPVKQPSAEKARSAQKAQTAESASKTAMTPAKQVSAARLLNKTVSPTAALPLSKIPLASLAKAKFYAANPGSADEAAKANAASPLSATVKSGASGKSDKYNGCKTCAERQYQDGSNDPGVSFQAPKGLPASTAGIFVASHEGEHVSRETEKARQEGREVAQKSVTLQMDCCPECKRMYVAGGVTKITTRGSSANVKTALDTLGQTGENMDSFM